MSSECDALKAEIGRLRQEIAALDNRFIPKTDRPKIIDDGLKKFKEIHPDLFKALFVGAFGVSIGPFAERMTDAELSIDLNKQKIRVTDGKATNAVSTADLAKTESVAASKVATAAKTEAATSLVESGKAVRKADALKRTVETLDGAVTALETVVDNVGRKATNALTKALKAIGIGEEALKVGGKALRLAGRLLGLIDIVFGILATLTIAQQLAAIIRRLNVIEATLSPIYGLIGVNRSRANAAKARADAAFAKATNAQSTATSATSLASSAQSTAGSALSTALNALTVASSLLFLRSLVPQIRTIATSAQTLAQRALTTANSAKTTAQTALQRARTAGPRGLPGLIGLPGRPGPAGAPGRNGARGLRGLGLRGLRGLTGLRGQTGRSAAPGARGQRGPRGIQGFSGRNGELTAADSALLRKIDATTTADLAVDRQNQRLIQGQNAIAFATLSSSKANGKGIGLERFPAAVPASLNANAQGAASINNLADLQVWQAQNLDSLMGVWPAKMTVESPIAGGAAQEVAVNTTSDMLQEIYGMTLALTIGQGIQTQIGTKTLIEAGATKQQAFLAHQYSAANADFLGYQGQRATAQMPMAFSPGKDLLEGLLTDTTVPVQGWKNTQRETLGTKLNELLQAAAIIKAVHYRKIDPNDVEGSIRRNVEAQADFPERDRENQDENENSDWNQYLQNVETGFSQEQPYGRNPEERPKIIDRSNLTNGNQPQS